MTDPVPALSPADATRITRELFGLEAVASPLTSERDQNVLMHVHAAPRLVLKVANANEERAFLEAQQRAMQHVSAGCDLTPKVVPMSGGGTLATIPGADGHQAGDPALRRRHMRASRGRRHK